MPRTVRVMLDVSAVPARPVGAGVYTIALARGLATSPAVDLHLIARRADASRWRDLAGGAEVHASVPDRRPARLVWEQRAAADLARHIGGDVWHGPHYTLPLRLHTPSVVTVHDMTFFDHPEWHERSKVIFFRPMIRAAAKRADAIICVSAYTASRLRARCAPRAEITVIPHGVDHGRFTPDGDRAADLAALAMHGITPPYIAFAGTIEPRKDLPTLVRAFAQLAPAHPDVRLVIAGGDGWGTKQLRDAIATSGCATRIVRPGYLRDDVIAPLFRHAAAVAYPSLEEGFGLPALEAMASGAPLVSTTGSAVEEVVADAATLVAPGDTDQLAKALSSVLDDEQGADAARAVGIKRAATFTWDRAVKAHIETYERAAHAAARA